jgi:hypothetical protein
MTKSPLSPWDLQVARLPSGAGYQYGHDQGEWIMELVRFLNNFDVRIEGSRGEYRVSAWSWPSGAEALRANDTDFLLPYSDVELDALLDAAQQRAVASQATPEPDLMRSVGGRLFEALFTGETLNLFEISLGEAQSQDVGLRIRLTLVDTAELWSVPWELLYDTRSERFLGLSNRTSLLRYVSLSDPRRPQRWEHPLRVLAVVSNPEDLPTIPDQHITVLEDLAAAGLVEVVRVERPSLSDLHERLLDFEPQVFHFVGHARFDPSAGEAQLALSREGEAWWVPGRDFVMLFEDARSLELAVLIASEGGRTGRGPSPGMAPALVAQGIPAVVAMQFPVTNRAALAFERTFYDELLRGNSVDAAVVAGRNSVFDSPDPSSWAAVVLYSSSPEAQFLVPARAVSDAAPRPRVASEAQPESAKPRRQGKAAVTRRGSCHNYRRDAIPRCCE